MVNISVYKASSTTSRPFKVSESFLASKQGRFPKWNCVQLKYRWNNLICHNNIFICCSFKFPHNHNTSSSMSIFRCRGKFSLFSIRHGVVFIFSHQIETKWCEVISFCRNQTKNDDYKPLSSENLTNVTSYNSGKQNNVGFASKES